VSRDQDSARFFDSAPVAPKLATDAAIYDLSALHAALSAPALQMPQQPSSWASDFMQQSRTPMTLPEQASFVDSNVALEAEVSTRRAAGKCYKSLLRAQGLT
jgi:hypothetical protein